MVHKIHDSNRFSALAFTANGKEYIAIIGGGIGIAAFGHPELESKPTQNMLWVNAAAAPTVAAAVTRGEPERAISTQRAGAEAPPEPKQVGHLICQYTRLPSAVFDRQVRVSARLGDMRHRPKRRCQNKLRVSAAADLAQKLLV